MAESAFRKCCSLEGMRDFQGPRCLVTERTGLQLSFILILNLSTAISVYFIPIERKSHFLVILNIGLINQS